MQTRNSRRGFGRSPQLAREARFALSAAEWRLGLNGALCAVEMDLYQFHFNKDIFQTKLDIFLIKKDVFRINLTTKMSFLIWKVFGLENVLIKVEREISLRRNL